MTHPTILSLAERHADLERRILTAELADTPDHEHIASLKRARLACRTQIRNAFRKKRSAAEASRRQSWRQAAASFRMSNLAPAPGGPGNAS